MKDYILFIVMFPFMLTIFVVGETITLPLKKLKLMQWDYWDYFNFMSDREYISDKAYLYWKQESFYKIRISAGILNIFGIIIEMIPMFSNKVYLTIDDNPIDPIFSEPIITPGTIKTTIWNWHIHKRELIHELKLKRNEIRKLEMEGDFK